MKHELAYVLTAAHMAELEDCIRLLNYADNNFTKVTTREGIIERLNALTPHLKACPELRKLPLVPRIPNVDPLTAAEINELNQFNGILHVYLTAPLRAACPESEDGYDLVDWAKAHWLIQQATPNDLALYVACLRRILLFTEGKTDYEAINVYLGVRVNKDATSDPVGWLENGMLFKRQDSSKFFLGGIQRSLHGIPEFHS